MNKDSVIFLCVSVAMAIAIFLPFGMQAQTLSETLNYKVLYKWGLIQKQAGRATFNLSVDGSHAHAEVYARTEPWVDRFYRLRDTLTSDFDRQSGRPSLYRLVQYEKRRYSVDEVKFEWKGNDVTGHVNRLRRDDNKGSASSSNLTLSASGFTVDLLSSFYYLRSIPFENLDPGYEKKINIFSGKKREILSIRYIGRETISFNDTKTPTFKVEFTFTTDGGKQSSDPIQAWLLTDKTHIPLKIVGKLKVGQIQCIYIP